MIKKQRKGLMLVGEEKKNEMSHGCVQWLLHGISYKLYWLRGGGGGGCGNSIKDTRFLIGIWHGSYMGEKGRG